MSLIIIIQLISVATACSAKKLRGSFIILCIAVSNVVLQEINDTIGNSLTIDSSPNLDEHVLPVRQGSEGVPASQYHQLLDGNLSSCIGLPVQGEVPPIFLLKMNTSSMKISSRAYNVTVVGDKISCNRHGSKLLQVSYPVSSGSPSQFVFCPLISQNLTKESQVECGYRCDCTNSDECREINMFMANHEQNTKWSLCELIARN